MARDVVFAANSLMSASDAWLTEVARRDPDMIRDVAAAMLARHDLLRPFAAKADKWEASHPGSVGVRRQDSKQIQHRLGDFRKAREAFEVKP